MKKSMFVMTIILLLSLVATSPATAKGGPDKAPTWELAFEPGPQMGYGTITYHGVEFRGKLYYNFWWTDTTDQIWGSPDGKSWSLAWDANSIQGGFESLGPMTVFKGQMYLAIGDWDGVYPDQIVRTRDGIHWEPVAWTGLHTDEFGYFFGT